MSRMISQVIMFILYNLIKDNLNSLYDMIMNLYLNLGGLIVFLSFFFQLRNTLSIVYVYNLIWVLLFTSLNCIYSLAFRKILGVKMKREY